jgi:hypothetical protein
MRKFMKKFICALLLCIFFSFDLFSEPSKELKTLILIIATDDKPAYRELQKIWEAYMNSDLKHFEAYFIRANPDLASSYEIKQNEISVRTQEGFTPGILNKTILSMEAMQSRLDEFDYVLRTNLSSFYPYENLLKYLTKLPRKNCYCGISLHIPKSGGDLPPELETIPFISGAGIILSRDAAKMLIKDHQELEKYKGVMPDDVFIGLFYQKKKVPLISAKRWDYPTHAAWIEQSDKVEDYAYHFRAKYNYNIRTVQDPYADEILTLKALLKRYYSIFLGYNT